MRTRFLTEGEVALARRVFRDTVPYERVRVTDALGFGGRQWVLWTPWRWYLHLGPELFADSLTLHSATLIHELAHVWDSWHSLFGFEYMANSAWAQGWAMLRGDVNLAYQFEYGPAWGSYGAEQKASLVEAWFCAGMAREHAGWVYMENNVWAGRNR